MSLLSKYGIRAATIAEPYYELTIPSSVINANLTNFPVTVKLTSSNFNFNLVTSSDQIYFTDVNNNFLNHEVEYFNKTEQRAVYHVKLLTILSSVNTVFKLFINGVGYTNGFNPTAVWDGNYRAVYHMGTSLNDSTANGYTASATNVSVVDALNSKGRNFAGNSNSFMTLPTATMPSGNDRTVFMVINGGTSLPRTTCLFWASNSIYRTFGTHLPWSDSNIYFDTGLGTSHSYNRLSTSLSTAQMKGSFRSWHLIHANSRGWRGVYDNAGLFLNGSATTSIGAAGLVTIGNDTNSGSSVAFWQGIMAELRISLVERSSAWVKAEHEFVLNNPISFTLVG